MTVCIVKPLTLAATSTVNLSNKSINNSFFCCLCEGWRGGGDGGGRNKGRWYGGESGGEGGREERERWRRRDEGMGEWVKGKGE